MKKVFLAWILILMIITTGTAGIHAAWPRGPLGQGYGTSGQQVNEVQTFHIDNNDVMVRVAGYNMIVTWADLYKYQSSSWVKCGTTQSCNSIGRFWWQSVGTGDYKLEIHYVYPSSPGSYTPYMYYYIIDYDPSIKGIWCLDGNTYDLSGNNIDGTLTGASYISGKYGSAVNLTGSNSYVSIPYSSFNNMSSFTLSAWIYPTGFSNGNPIVSKVDPNRDFVLQLDSSGRLNFHIAYGATYYHCTNDKTVPLNKWTHVAAVYTTGGTITLYQDGVMVKEVTYSGIAPLWTGTIMGIGTMDNVLFFKGRIDNVKICATAMSAAQIRADVGSMPVSGYEASYQPGKWSDYGTIQNSTNCYAYALNLQKDPVSKYSFPLPWGIGYCLQPGELAHKSINMYTALSDPNAATIIQACKDDAAYIGGVFAPVGRNETCPSGTYKVALFLDLGNDYHWYRQNPDNTWSHKRGKGVVENYDAWVRTIIDPQWADRNYIYESGINYSTFVGYFAVKPIAAGGPSTTSSIYSSYYNFETEPTTQSTMMLTQSQSVATGTLTRSDFAFLRLGMRVDEVVAVVGAPHREVGSGIIMDAYDLQDGSIIVLNYGPKRDGLKKVALIHPDKTREFILQ